MTKKTLANDLMHTNSEYQKLKGDDGRTPRETPAGQSSGRAGYNKQNYDQWTKEELVQQAERLEVPAAMNLSREDLESALLSRDATQARLVR